MTTPDIAEARRLADDTFNAVSQLPSGSHGRLTMSRAAAMIRALADELERLREWADVARDRGAEIGRLRAQVAPAGEAVASLYISPHGEREIDDWKCKLPPGRHELFTAAAPAQPITPETGNATAPMASDITPESAPAQQAGQAPAVNDGARMQWLAVHFPKVRLWFLEGQSRWGIENVPGAWNTLREAVDAVLASKPPVQPKEPSHDHTKALADALERVRKDMIADTRTVFDANGSETPQVVRDVIEYVDSWLQVQVGRMHDRAAQQAAALDELIASGEEIDNTPSLTVGERGAPLDVTLDEAQAKVLRDHIVIGDDDDDVAPIRLLVGSGHSGYGLYLAQAEYQDEGSVLLHEMPTPAPMKAADEFELRRLLSEERETTRQLTRALAEATEGSTFMGEPVVPSNPPAQGTGAANSPAQAREQALEEAANLCREEMHRRLRAEAALGRSAGSIAASVCEDAIRALLKESP